MTDDLLRKRTDAIIATLLDTDYDISEYLSIAKESENPLDMVLPQMIEEKIDQPYKMRNLNAPMSVASMSLKC